MQATTKTPSREDNCAEVEVVAEATVVTAAFLDATGYAVAYTLESVAVFQSEKALCC